MDHSILWSILWTTLTDMDFPEHLGKFRVYEGPIPWLRWLKSRSVRWRASLLVLVLALARLFDRFISCIWNLRWITLFEASDHLSDGMASSSISFCVSVGCGSLSAPSSPPKNSSIVRSSNAFFDLLPHPICTALSFLSSGIMTLYYIRLFLVGSETQLLVRLCFNRSCLNRLSLRWDLCIIIIYYWYL